MKRLITLVAMIAFASVTGCATAPESVEERQTLEARAAATVQEMTSRDPGLRELLSRSPAYVVFPEIGKGGVIVGGAYGRGVMFERGRPTGFVEVNQASFGAQLGAETISELLVLQDTRAVNRLKGGSWELGGNVSAVVLTTGAAAGARFVDGVTVFQVSRGGAMVEAAAAGQKLNFEPRE